MVHHSQADPAPDPRRHLEAQLRECFGWVVYSHKTHEKCADILLSRNSTIKVLQIVFSALSAVGFLGAVFGTNRITQILGVIVSGLLLALNAYTKDYDLGGLAQQHRQAAADLWLIRETYLSLITDLAVGDKALREIQEARDALLIELHQVYVGAPSTTFKAYKKAQEALKTLEDLTFSEAEIDAFLPAELRRAKNQGL